MAANPKFSFVQTRTYTGRGNKSKVPIPSNTHLYRSWHKPKEPVPSNTHLYRSWHKPKVPVPSNTHLYRSWQQIQTARSFKHAPIQVMATNPKCPFVQTRTFTGRGNKPKVPIPSNTHLDRGSKPKVPVPSNTHLNRSWQQTQNARSFKHAPIQVVA